MKQKLLIAGGGTGGHLFSGLAVAEEWIRRGGLVSFVGAQSGLEKDLLPRYGHIPQLLPVMPFKGKGLGLKLKMLVTLPRSFAICRKILKKIGPDIVLGIGGYASGPTVLMARLMGIPTAVVDQNSVPGMTNRLLGRWVRKVFISFENAAGYFNSQKVVLTGNPIPTARIPTDLARIKPANWTPQVLLVCGGSQGARAVNQLVVQAVAKIAQKFSQLRVIHQTGSTDWQWVSQEIKKTKIDSLVAPFFDDMEKYYASADLVVARSGAGTVTELALWGRPSILIPFPSAADDHQTKNALELVKAGGAVMFKQSDLNSDQLAEEIMGLMGDPEKLRQMAQAARQVARPDAAKKVVDELLKL